MKNTLRPCVASLNVRQLCCLAETQHPRHDGGGERHQAAPGDRAADLGREEVPARRREGRRGLHQAVSGAICGYHLFK